MGKVGLSDTRFAICIYVADGTFVGDSTCSLSPAALIMDKSVHQYHERDEIQLCRKARYVTLDPEKFVLIQRTSKRCDFRHSTVGSKIEIEYGYPDNQYIKSPARDAKF